MALTGRAALVAALGSLPVGILAPSWTGILAVEVPLSLAILCDYALAAPVRTLQFTRSGDTSVRLGETAAVQLTVTNPSRRRLRAHLRDAWPPSSWTAEAEQASSRHQFAVPAGRTPPPDHAPASVTARRPPGRPSHRQIVRSPRSRASRQGYHRVPWTVRALPPFTEPEAPALAPRSAPGTRRPDQCAHAGRGHGVRQPARLRPGRRHPFHRLAGHRPPVRGRCPYLAPRARPPHPRRPGHRPHIGGPGGRRTAARRRHGRDPPPHRPRHPRGRPREPDRLRPTCPSPGAGQNSGRGRPGDARQHAGHTGARARGDRRSWPQHGCPGQRATPFPDRPAHKPGRRAHRGRPPAGPSPSSHSATRFWWLLSRTLTSMRWPTRGAQWTRSTRPPQERRRRPSAAAPRTSSGVTA